MKTFKVVFSAISIMLVIGILVVGVYVNYFLGQYTVDDIRKHFRYDLGEIDMEDDLNDDLKYDIKHDEDLLEDDQIINVLLVGSDAYTTNERGRSDSMMIATIDMKHKKLKVTSLLRDTYVELPGTDSKGNKYGWRKLNSAYAVGDAAFLIETIEHNFNISIDKYAVVNFTLFRNIIDRIGGIDIKLTADEASYLRGRREDEAGPNRHNMKEGWNTLDGWCALEYARARSYLAGPFIYTDENGDEVKLTNDYARTARQRHVLETIFNKMKNEDITTLLGIAEDCMKMTRTNITLAELTSYVKSVVSIGADGISQLQIPMKGYFYPNENPAYLYMSEENLKINVSKLKEFIFEY